MTQLAVVNRKKAPSLYKTWPWRITIGYLVVMLLLPIAALLANAITVAPQEFWAKATSPIALAAYEVTFVTALGTALVNGVFGTLIAWVLVRYSFPGKKIINGIIDLPFALPTSVAGLTLATIYSPKGLIGGMLAPLGIKIAFTRLGVVIAMLFVSLPFVVRTLQPVLEEMEKETEEAAWSLGATPSQTFWQVILPPLMPAILTGVTLGFSRSVGEYGSIVMVSANRPFQDLIASVLIWQSLESYDIVGATAIGTVLLLISLVLLLLINWLQAWGQRYSGRSKL
jgi:sulfate/thiosulfate transport system permease protein